MPITFRPATPADTRRLFDLSEHAVADFARRQGYPWDQGPSDAALWAKRQPMFEFLAANANPCWLAEDEEGELVGYARSIVNEGVRELTEFFVRPDRQSAGVGGELLRRAFPAEDNARRFIVATSDQRALACYLKAGVYARFPIFDFRRQPELVSVETDLTFEPLPDSAAGLATVAALDQAVLGYRRDTLHAWLAGQRTGFLALRGGQPAGYGYVGDDTGPIAALSETDLPALLAHAETLAHAQGAADLGFEVPLINRAAVNHLLGRGYRMDPFFAFFMSDAVFGRFENYVVFSPPFFV